MINLATLQIQCTKCKSIVPKQSFLAKILRRQHKCSCGCTILQEYKPLRPTPPIKRVVVSPHAKTANTTNSDDDSYNYDDNNDVLSSLIIMEALSVSNTCECSLHKSPDYDSCYESSSDDNSDSSCDSSYDSNSCDSSYDSSSYD